MKQEGFFSVDLVKAGKLIASVVEGVEKRTPTVLRVLSNFSFWSFA